jgi:dihydroflavonol-4-reductase|tara:strand:+ start:2591 stop:3613 length:1023 start_codon:yes stop_codon:yes gene_type:complete
MDFITGATGIVGREVLAQLLESGKSVKALRREGSDVESVMNFLKQRGLNPVESELCWAEGDVTDLHSLEGGIRGCKTVFHVAAVVSFHPSDEALMMEVNVGGTANVVNTMLDQGVTDLIYVSSVAALGYTPTEPITEQTVFEDGPLTTGYSRSKNSSELEVWRGQEEGLNVVMVNPSIIVGPGDFTKSSGELFSQVDNGIPFYPTGTNGFVSVVDVARACILLADTGIRGQRFLLNAENRSYKDFFSTIATELSVKAPSRPVQNWMAGVVWRGFWIIEKLTGKKALVTKESLKMVHLPTEYDGSKIRKALLEKGVEWNYSSVNEAISSTSKVYLSEKAGS